METSKPKINEEIVYKADKSMTVWVSSRTAGKLSCVLIWKVKYVSNVHV